MHAPALGPEAAAYTTSCSYAHAVAAAVYEAVGGGSRPDEVMGRMVGMLAAMHERNPAWGAARPAALDPAGKSRVA